MPTPSTHPLLAHDAGIFDASSQALADEEKKTAHLLIRPGAGGLDQARGLTLGPNGDLFVSSAGSHNWAILRFDSQSGKFKEVVFNIKNLPNLHHPEFILPAKKKNES